jgi:hypothetical protein
VETRGAIERMNVPEAKGNMFNCRTLCDILARFMPAGAMRRIFSSK